MPESSTAARVPKLQRLNAFWKSIKGRIFLVFVITFLSVFALTLLNYWSMSTAGNRLLLLESYEDIANNILEVRRFEKNYLLYDDPASLHESISYLHNVERLLDEFRPDIINVIGQEEYADLVATFSEYQSIVSASREGRIPNQDRLRVLGKELVKSATTMLENKRKRVHKAIVRTSVIPFTLLAIFIVLMVIIIKLISVGLLKPLDKLKITTQRVARGDFRPISMNARRLEEISALIDAFNRMAHELETNQEDLLQARKIAALGTFTAGIAHELNNPINNISLTAETLQEIYEDDLDQDGHEMIQDILTQTYRAGEIVKNLLDFSRTERPEFKRLSVNKVIDSTARLVKNQFMLSGATLKTDIPGDIPPIQGDLRNLQQVFMNLMLNAVQAMPEGGTVTVTAREEPQEMVRIDVRDTGVGIDPDSLQQIFEPFFTTKQVGKGTGLGLSVLYSIVKRHGGRVEVKSELGQGSTFSVFLPQSKQVG